MQHNRGAARLAFVARDEGARLYRIERIWARQLDIRGRHAVVIAVLEIMHVTLCARCLEVPSRQHGA